MEGKLRAGRQLGRRATRLSRRLVAIFQSLCSELAPQFGCTARMPNEMLLLAVFRLLARRAGCAWRCGRRPRSSPQRAGP